MDRLRGKAYPGLALAGEAEAQKLPPPWPVDRAFLLIDFEF
ncbi:hypothetical protein J2S00_003893 [Caldalkalibacillus uzonensis]|uniref:Uncharacterized protein n=1 Tax=Caldalkalibacillus uzonensis TaxID=353224 RepID=A0ABU0CY40_9BACI|nr:hypothetical protein [Caldalkalibacillus uzonensis]